MIKQAMKAQRAKAGNIFLLAKLTPFKLWLLSLLITLSLAEVIALSLHMLMGGHVDYDYLFTVLVFALLAASVVGAMFITLVDKQAMARHLHPKGDTAYPDVRMNQAAVQADDILQKADLRGQELANKQWFLGQLEKALATGGRTHKCGALLSVDLGPSSCGQDNGVAGNLLSQQMAQRLTQCLRKSDTVVQIGNAEFVLLLESLGEDSEQAAMQAKRIAEHVLEKFKLPLRLKNYTQTCMPRIGICLFDKQPLAPYAVLKSASLAMYQALASGKRAIRFFDGNLQELTDARTLLQAELQRGWQFRQFRLHYQPQADFNGCIIGAEALLRWQHPQRGLLPAHEFLALAEDSGLGIALGDWVLVTAGAQLATWAQSSATAHLILSVNISAVQLKQADFADRLLSLLENAGANPCRLKLELTEKTLTAESATAKTDILKAKGISICLDNFGTAASSLSCLQRGLPDQIKIDRSLINGMLPNPAEAAVVRAIIAMGAGLGITVVAAGVEHRQQREMLAKQGCHYYQGYHLAEAMPPHEFAQLFAAASLSA